MLSIFKLFSIRRKSLNKEAHAEWVNGKQFKLKIINSHIIIIIKNN